MTMIPILCFGAAALLVVAVILLRWRPRLELISIRLEGSDYVMTFRYNGLLVAARGDVTYHWLPLGGTVSHYVQRWIWKQIEHRRGITGAFWVPTERDHDHQDSSGEV